MAYCLLCKRRDEAAAIRFLKKDIHSSGMPAKVTLDKRGSNTAALNAINKPLKKEEQIEIRQIKYLNNIIEQDHRLDHQTYEGLACSLGKIEQFLLLEQQLPLFDKEPVIKHVLIGINICKQRNKDQHISNTSTTTPVILKQGSINNNLFDNTL